jgi:hypothetical protein
MKPFIAIILLLFLKTSHGQRHADTTLSKQTLDSILSVNNSLKEAYEKQAYRIRVQTETFKVDTTNLGQDSTIINYKTKGGKLLKKVEQYKNNGCILYETENFYNGAVFLQYRQKESRSCGTPKNTDPDIKMISGFVQEMERFVYDNSGRVTLRVWWYYSIGTRRYSYSYSANNEKTTKITYIDQNEFWL